MKENVKGLEVSVRSGKSVMGNLPVQVYKAEAVAKMAHLFTFFVDCKDEVSEKTCKKWKDKDKCSKDKAKEQCKETCGHCENAVGKML